MTEKEALEKAAQTTRFSPEELGNKLQKELKKYKESKVYKENFKR